METTIVGKIKRYNTYKDSGVEWLGEIPEHWEVKRLKFIFEEIQTGSTPSTSNQKFYGGNIDWYTPKDLDNDELIFAEKKLNQLAIKEREVKFFPEDSILIVGIGATAGKTSYLINKGTFNQQITGFHSHKVNNKYFFYLFFSLSDVMLNTANYTTLAILNNEFFKVFSLVKPPLSEQTAIAKFLDDKTEKIDQAISIKEQQIALLKEHKQILIHKAVTRGLDDSVPLKDSGVEWIGEIPEHWEVKKVTHLFDEIGSGTTPTAGDIRYYDGEYNFLQTGDLNDDKIIFTKRSLKERAFKVFTSLKLYPKGSLVMAMYGATIGKLGILDIESATNQACCVFGATNKIEMEYFFQILWAFRPQIISFGYGGGQPNISQDLIKSLRFPVAPLSEQKEISEYIESASQKIDSAISLKTQETEKLKEYKNSLINSVVTGKVRVS